MQMQARVCLQGERTWSNTAGADGQFVNGASSGGQRVGEEPSAGESPSSIEFEFDSVIEVERCVAGFRQWLGIDNFGISASQRRRTGYSPARLGRLICLG